LFTNDFFLVLVYNGITFVLAVWRH